MKISRKGRTEWILRTVAVLLYLVLLSTWMLSGLSARFVTGGSAGDEARVAVFDITESSTMSHQFAVTMKPGNTDSNDIRIVVKNSSETAVSYTIAFELGGNLPLTVAPTENQTGETALSKEDGTLVWHTVSEMAGSERTYSFQLTWDEAQNSYQYAEGIESVTVVITAVQED
jgi:hypothetical protein